MANSTIRVALEISLESYYQIFLAAGAALAAGLPQEMEERTVVMLAEIETNKEVMNMEVTIPFKDRFRDPMLNGIKVMTCRPRAMGKAGDTFTAFGSRFELRAVENNKRLGAIVAFFWREEGCESEEDFIAVWQSIHPRKGYDPDQQVVAHFFQRIDGGES